MAHAARLNLRMQKELKLLLTDPPPNATFPCLSEQEQSLTSIDARLKGPEGTAYADGVFNLNIQIPERYPFQPPMVKFTTPVYHPNIDNGGRICLDILNLPPKGTWQPSLNISTVITSIGLLLSEPNPDDGLMHEASMDYKYNNQAFEQKARAMTEKYARTGEAESSKGGSGSETPTHPITEHTEIVESSVSTNEQLRCHKRLHGISRKLSLDSSGSSSKRESDKLISDTRSSSEKHVEPGWFKEPKVVIEHIENPNSLQVITRSDNEKKKMSQCMQEEKENVAPRQHLQHQLQDQSDALHMMSSSTSSDDDIIRKPRKQLKLFNATTKKLVPSKPLSKVLGCATNLTLHTRGSSNLDSKLVIASSAANSDDSKLENNRDCKVNCAKLEKMSKHSSPISAAEALIVLDSEDSDEGEDVMQSMRSKLSLRRRHKRLSRTS